MAGLTEIQAKLAKAEKDIDQLFDVCLAQQKAIVHLTDSVLALSAPMPLKSRWRR